jgi:3',5'-nucleoside bisphosphate phosphatase
MRFVDLHLHTNHSDGVDSPAEVVARACQVGLSALAITDHDTVSGVPEARDAAQEAGLGFLCGTEFSATFSGVEVHVLGLGIDTGHARLASTLEELREGRETRADAMIERLNELGVPIRKEKVEARTASSIGRLHIAQEIRTLGHVRTVQQGFDKYIGQGRPAYVDKPRIPCHEAIELIHEAGGLAFLAHPGLGAVKKEVTRLLELPFDGIEVYHSRHSPGQSDGFMTIAKERGLLISGGSDCHGEAKTKALMGKVRLPYEYFERIQAALGK